VTPGCGDLLLATADSGERSRDVLCVIDADGDAAGALFALVLNRPLDEPAQPLVGSIWLSSDQAQLYRDRASLPATDETIFDAQPDLLADRLRGSCSD